jgi:hypothetical protein
MKKVFVYYNLHKHKWSVKDVKTGRVIGHYYDVSLYNAKFKVSAAGRARVLKEKRKNVHAGVEGYLTKDVLARKMDGTILWESQSERHKVTYNPYKYDTFVTVSDKEPIHKSYFVRMVAYGTNWDGKGQYHAPDVTAVVPVVKGLVKFHRVIIKT